MLNVLRKILIVIITLLIITLPVAYWLYSPAIKQAQSFCAQKDVWGVYLKGDYIQVNNYQIGGGPTYYPIKGGKSFGCPVVPPGSESAECKNIKGLSIRVCGSNKLAL